MRAKFALVLVLFLVVQPAPANVTPEEEKVPQDIVLGHPRVWGYDRVYPLLDGLFQDVASTQLAQLTLNPNAPNGSALDAIQNAFQLAVSFSQTAGLQNNLAQQMNGTLGANAALQTQLLGIEGPLIQSAIAAQQQVASAQALVDQLSQSTAATAAQQSAAAQALKVATDNLNGLTNQLSTIKTQLGTVPSSPASFSPPSTNAQSSPPTLPSNLTGLTSPPGSDKNTPSFPSSKQLDNQVNLLWERLSRLVSTLAQPDSLKNYTIDLVELNVGITPVNRKKQLLGVEYQVECTTCTKERGAIVLDLFPSASAVNIIDTKYRENRVGLAALLSWFTVGLNASYNRDHLKMSQALGQSAYITGYGVGKSQFGWIFGRNLGDDTITPGNRTLFALIAVPKAQDAKTAVSATTFSVRATRAAWFHDNSEKWYKHEVTLSADASPTATFDVASGDEATAAAPATEPQNSIISIAYVPSDYDPSGATKTMVSVAVQTSETIDPQQTISINGRFLKRSRDNFGRGVGTGGSGGLLETTTLDSNSWVPTGSRAFILTLDPSAFGRRFPDIRIATPSGSYSATEQLKHGGARISIGGRNFACEETCPSDLPALGYPKATTRQLLVSQWHKQSDEILLSVVGDSSSTSNSNAPSSTPPTLQVISGDDQPSWGGDAVVLARFGEITYRLVCAQSGSRLICETPAIMSAQRPFDTGFALEVVDPDHAGGPLRAWQSVQKCEDASIGPLSCSHPLVRNLGQPHWERDSSRHQQIDLHLDLINMKPGQTVSLWGGPSNGVSLAGASCPTTPTDTCGVDLTVAESDYGNISDLMEIRFGGGWQAAKLQYLRSITQPILSGINDTQTILTGQNLRFTKLGVGDSGRSSIDMSCSDSGSECRFDKYPAGAEGYLYFETSRARIQVFQVKGNTLSPIYHTAPPATPGANPNNKVPPLLLLPQVNNNFNLLLKPNEKRLELSQ